MSLETVLSSLGLSRRDQHSLESQLHSMRREVDKISRELSRRAERTAGSLQRQAGHRADVWSRQAGNVADEWGDQIADFGREAVKQGSQIAEYAGDQAMRGVKAVRRDPLPALAVIGTVLLVASFFRR